MRNLTGNDNLFGTWFENRDKITYNYLCYTKDNGPRLLVTDDRCFLAAQSGEKAPLWVYFRNWPDGEATGELTEFLSDMVRKKPDLHLISGGEAIVSVLEKVSEKLRIPFGTTEKKNVYSRETPIRQNAAGAPIKASNSHRSEILKLIKTMKADSAGITIGDGEAEEFYRYAVSSGNVFLWEDAGIRSMANIAYRTDRFARINIIVTDRNSRGKGYAGMLVAEISNRLLSEGLIPVIYADADYPPSNRTYRRIGFEKQGELTGYSFRPTKKKEETAF